MNLLEITDLHASYGAIEALRGVSIKVPAASVISVLGANGAGKSTLLNVICGQVPGKSGSIRFDGEEIFGMPAHHAVTKGIAMSPEGRKLFPEMTVYENLRVGGYSVRDRATLRERIDVVMEIFPRLRERSKQQASLMSGGEQQMVAIARALMVKPKLLVLDEPTLGLAPKLIHDVADIIRRVSADGISILLVEQNARLALQLSSYSYVLESGAVALEGKSADLLDNDEIRKIYLGA